MSKFYAVMNAVSFLDAAESPFIKKPRPTTSINNGISSSGQTRTESGNAGGPVLKWNTLLGFIVL